MLDSGGVETTPIEPSEGERKLSSALVLPGSYRNQTWIAELLAVFCTLFAIDFLFFSSFGDFFALNPHPFWIPVLLLSLHYGFTCAVVAAATAITLDWLFFAPQQNLGEPYFDFVVRHSMLPAMWLTTALIVGELRQRQIRERAQVDEELERLRAQTEVLSKHCTETKQANLDLQLKIAAGKTAPIEHALMQLGSRQSRDAEHFVTTFKDALVSLIGEHKASIFLLNEQANLDLAFQFGWREDDHYRRALQPDHPLYRAVITQSQQVSLHRSSWDDQVLQGEGEVAVPIQYIVRSGTIGMLKIEAAGKQISSFESLRALVVLGRELGIFLEQLEAEANRSKPNHEISDMPLRAAG